MAARSPIVGVIVQDEQIRVRMAAWTGELSKGLHRVLVKATERIEKTAKKSIISGKKRGKVYRKGTATEHRASAAGQAPASDAGDLLSSITSSITEAGSTVKHGLYLELGTRKMKPRPYLLPARDKHLAKIEADILRELNK